MEEAGMRIGLVLVAVGLLFTGCTKNQPAPAPDRAVVPDKALLGPWVLSSTVLTEGQPIDKKYTCDGNNISPPLSWTAPPANAASLALIVDDPDAPSGTFTHWLLYAVLPSRTSLAEGIEKVAAVKDVGRQGKSDFGKVGYGGPCPPAGKPHHYRFKLLALSADPGIAAEADRAAVDKAIAGRIIGQAMVTVLYTRAR
jgi:hypothetical protein